MHCGGIKRDNVSIILSPVLSQLDRVAGFCCPVFHNTMAGVNMRYAVPHSLLLTRPVWHTHSKSIVVNM